MNHKDNISPQAEPYRRKKRRSVLWKRVISVLGCVVVFVTTYALILPAMTLDDTPVCGYEEHRHDSSCYIIPDPGTQLSCSVLPHQHTDGCGGRCGYADFFLHSHSTDSGDSGHFVCKLPEIAAHTHSDACYTETSFVACGLEESEGHVHGEGCFANTLICTEAEAEPHTHEDACYGEDGALVCSLPESEGHTHGELCYSTEPALICEIPESEGHTHSAACMSLPEKVLICQEAERILHIHTDDCFDESGAWICGLVELVEHIHSDACLVSVEMPVEPVLICEQTEHLHTDSCFPAPGETDSTGATDPTASTTVTDPTDSTLVTDPTESTDVTDSTESTEVTDPTESTLVTEPAELAVIEKIAVIYTDGTYAELSEDATVITVTGLIPEDAEVRAYPATVMSEQDVLCAYDLTIFLSDGTVFEPAEGETLSVRIQTPDLKGSGYYPEVYYIPEEGEPERIDTTITEDGVKFDTDHFSVYAVLAADIRERIPTGAPGSYYHSHSMPRYQTSPFRVHDRDFLIDNVHTAETYVLISVDEYGGKTWIPDSVNWSAAGNHNYVVAYCCDYDHTVSGDGRTFYMYKIALENSKFNASQRKALQVIVENSYPFITEAEVRARLEAAGYTGTFTASEMLAAAQIAIWQVVSNDAPSVYDNVVPDNSNVLNPITTKGPGTERDVENIINYLKNDATTADPGNLEVTDTVWNFNEDGSYSVTVTLNRPVVEGETLNASLSDASRSFDIALEPGTTQFTLEWPAGLNEGTNITLNVSGKRTAFVVYYYDDGGKVQDLVSGEYKDIEMNYQEVLVRSITNVTVEKKWIETDPSLRPPYITVYLTINGERVTKTGVSPIVLNESNNWKYTWSNLPTANNHGALVYGVEEIVPTGYAGSYEVTSKNGNKYITLINTQLPAELQTELNVTKEWEDGAEIHIEDTIIVHLYADGVYTGKDLVLNAESKWFGTFSGLPYYQEDGITPIVYTIVEEPFKDYVPEYSEAVPTSDPLANWSEVRDLTPGGIYRFVSEGLALSCGSDGSLIAAVDNVEDISQWWRAASIDDCWILTNLATEKSISFIGDTFTTTNSGVILGFSHGRIFNMPIEGDTNYLRMSAEAVEATASSKEATVFTVYQKASVDKVPIYNILLINHENPSYELPDTGGIGFEIFTLGGSLLMAAAFVCILAQRKKDSTV